MRNTPNYNLPQFDGTDKFDKDVLNDAYLKLDEAINDLQETFNLGAGDAGLLSKEVVEARKGKAKLVDKITELEESDKDLDTEINVLKIADTTNKKELQDQIDTWHDFKANGGEIGGRLDVIGKGNTIGTRYNDTHFNSRIWDNYVATLGMFYGENQVNLTKIDFLQDRIEFNKDIYIYGSYNNSTNGYTKLPNGMVMQWGRIYDIPINGDGVLSFPIEFPNRVFSVTTGLLAWHAIDGHFLTIDYLNNKNFTYHVRSAKAQGAFYWMAIGY